MVVKQPNSGESGNRLTSLRKEIDQGLDRLLQTQGAERSALTIRLLRLRWEVEELEAST